MVATFSTRLAAEPHSQRWNKILISEYDFAVNIVISAIHKLFIIHDLVSKLLITKISLVERTSV